MCWMFPLFCNPSHQANWQTNKRKIVDRELADWNGHWSRHTPVLSVKKHTLHWHINNLHFTRFLTCAVNLHRNRCCDKCSFVLHSSWLPVTLKKGDTKQTIKTFWMAICVEQKEDSSVSTNRVPIRWQSNWTATCELTLTHCTIFFPLLFNFLLSIFFTCLPPFLTANLLQLIISIWLHFCDPWQRLFLLTSTLNYIYFVYLLSNFKHFLF